MLFHTWTFVLFFAIVYPVYLAVRRTRLRVPWLLAASYLFYGWWNPYYLVLILYATAADWLVVLAMSRSRRRGAWLAVSVANNLGLLGFFKYGDFFVTSVNTALGWAGVAWALPSPAVLMPAGLPYLLPVGISFFVFQSMTYTIGYYRGEVEREPRFLRYAAFVSLFPQLLSGPIERARHLLPQLAEAPRITGRDLADGASLFLAGLFKKVALADYLALYVDNVYGAPAAHQGPALALATLAFAWQLYFDFSGYTDMARGVARAMGIRLMLNFNHPYLATGLGDFWNRWHISLSTWFKDYVYIPLGGNRRGEVRTYVNMALTMVLSGLWHGAAWTFVAWGAVHALGRVLTRRLETTAWYRERVPTAVKRVGVFLFVTFAWIFFRARSFGDAWLIVGRIARFAATDPAVPLLAMAMVGAVWLYEALCESRARGLLEAAPVRVGLAAAMALWVALFASSGGQAFIYFQF